MAGSGHGQASGRVRIGCGAGFANDRIGPARELAERGALDFLFFEGLAERTLAHSQLAREKDPKAGFNPRLIQRLAAVLPACRAQGTRIVTNMGAANPRGAGEAALLLAREIGLSGLRIAVVEGDDVTATMSDDTPLLEGGAIKDFGRPLIAANAYLGAEGIAEGLGEGADVVITGRVADPSLVLGPLIHHFGWKADDWPRLGAGTLVGHLMECGFQITGGYFADPGRKDVRDLARLSYPIAEVEADGSAMIGKLPDTGGCVTRQTVLEQMLYEVHDPRAYLTPDVTADFGGVRIEEVGPDRVAVHGATGAARPERLKATVSFRGGLLAEAEISYAGEGAGYRGALAGDVLREVMQRDHGCTEALRIDLIGVSALHASARDVNLDLAPARDVRMRAAMRTDDPGLAEALLQEVECLWTAGPAGGGGMRGRITPTIVTRSALVDRAEARPRLEVMVA